MAELLDSALSFKDDETRMADLQRRGGLESLAAATAAYQTATELVMDRLVALAEEPQGSRSLFRAGRSLKQTGNDPSRFFADAGSFDGQQLVRDVLGDDGPVVVDSVADATDLPTDKALNLVQIATALIISLAAGEAGDEVTLDSITAPIRNERRADALVTADAGVAGPVADGAAPLADTAPEIAVANAAQGDPVSVPEETGKRKAWLVALVPVAAIAGVGLFVASNSGDQPPEVVASDAESNAVSTTITTTTQSTPADETETAAEPTTTAPIADATTTPPTEETPQPATEAPSPPAPPGAPANYSILSRGKIFLRGTVPSAEVETAIVDAVTQILGPGNVISEYEIDPRESFEEGRESFVFIDEAVLFATGSAEIAPDFAQLLGLGLTLLRLQDGVTLEVTGHTDAQGDEAVNLALSQARVDAVKEFFVSQGIDSDRIVAVGKGETEPRADNETPEGRQANRRVEFIVNGFSFS